MTVSRGGTATTSTGVLVPDVLGDDQATATNTLRSAGFGVTVVDQTTDDPPKDGIVLAEKPTAGTRASRGSSVSITVGRYQSG